MSETQQTTVDEAGITRTPTGDIAQTQPEVKTPTPEVKIESTEKTGDTKPTETTKTSDGKSLLNAEDDKTAKPEGAPEKYADFKLPEGVALAPDTLTAATGLFKELGLSQDGAQKLLDFHLDAAQKLAAAPMEAYNNTRQEWRDAVMADKDIGPKFKEVRSAISKTIDAVAGPELGKTFREAMDITGAGDHPAFVKVFHKMALAFSEGTHVKGSGPSPLGQTAPGKAAGPSASALYPHLPSSGR